MTEFVGLNTGAATELCTTMRTAADGAGSLKSALSDGISAAGADFAGAKGAEVVSQAGTFLTESERDLKWRIETITKVPGNQRVGQDFRVADFPYTGPDAAKAAGEADGQKLRDAWEEYLKNPGLGSYNDFLKKLKVQGVDPAYMAGMLNKLGPEAYRKIFDDWMTYNKDPYGKGLTPKELEELKKDLGPLAQAFATADAAGMVPNLRKFIVEKGSPDFISAMLVVTPQSKDFVVAAGEYLAAAVTSHTGPEKNWRLHWLFTALGENPEAFAALLAKDKKNAEMLLRPEVLEEGGTPGFKALISTALDRAMHTQPDATRRMALLNVSKVFGNSGVWKSVVKNDDLKRAFVDALGRDLDDKANGKAFFQDLAQVFSDSGKPPSILKDADVNTLFTKHLSTYLPALAGLQAARNDKELKELDPGDGWDKLSDDELDNLFAGVFQRKEGREGLTEAVRKFQATLDPGNGNLNDPEQRKKFITAMAQAAGLGGIMVGAVHNLDMDAEERRRFVTEMLLLPVDLTIGKLGRVVPTDVGSTIWKNMLEEVGKWPAGDRIAKSLDKDDGGFLGKLPLVGGLFRDDNDNGEASDLARELADEHMRTFQERLKAAGQPPLSPADTALLRNSIEGLYFEPLIKALKKRGG